MTMIDFKPVKRCSKCHRLIRADFDSCPYCSSDDFSLPTSEPIEAPVQAAPSLDLTMSPQVKKGLRITAIVAVVGCLLYFGYGYVANFFILDKSITEELSASNVEYLTKDDPEFADKYRVIEEVRNELLSDGETEKYKSITYKDFLAYLDTYTDATTCEEYAEEASANYETTCHEPVISKVAEIKAEWETYIKEHDLAHYIKIVPHDRYERDGYYYYPGFYFDLTFPNGPIEDCYVEYGLWNKDYGYWHSSATSNANLSALRERCRDNQYRWSYVSSYSQDILDDWTTKVEIISVTKADGTIIRSSDANNVPYEVKAYIEDPSEDNEVALVRALIDEQYPDKKQFVADAVEKRLEQENPKCFALIKKLERTYSAVPNGWSRNH